MSWNFYGTYIRMLTQVQNIEDGLPCVCTVISKWLSKKPRVANHTTFGGDHDSMNNQINL